MDLHYIDFVSVSGKSWLHRVPAGIKLLGVVAIIGFLLMVESIAIEAGILAVVLVIGLSARLPIKVFTLLMLYPALFLAVLLISIERLTIDAALVLILRVIAITASVLVMLLSTSYPAIFSTLGHILPGFLTAALFFTYRSIFVIGDSISDIQTAMHLRGGFNWRHPIMTIRHFGTALGHFVVNSIDTSQRMADSLSIRGFKNRIYYRRDGGK